MAGSVLRAWRNRMGWDRTTAASQLHITQREYASYEDHNSAIPVTLLDSIQHIERDVLPTKISHEGSRIKVVGGGTVVHVRNHLAVSAPAYGPTAREIATICYHNGDPAELFLTRMADPASPIETNDDMAELVESIVADENTKIVFWNPAICDFSGHIGDVESGRKADRLHTREGEQTMSLRPTDKLVGRIRRSRKDIFLVAFKTTTGKTEDEMYLAGLNLMKSNHINLVLVNDTVNKMNMVVTPEEARYHVTDNRVEALEGLVDMALLRSTNTFTRSTVEESDGVPWNSPLIGDNLREVVNYCIERGAYRPHKSSNGLSTVGHFASRGKDGNIITSRRWSNFNDLADTGMIEIEPVGDNQVIARGGKPSVGGQSQRIIFTEHPNLNHIVHFHCPVKKDAPDVINVREQRPYECGSHECGKNTSDGIRDMGNGIHAVMLDNHGPNIVFGDDVPAHLIIDFIERNFDLDEKTGGPVN